MLHRPAQRPLREVEIFSKLFYQTLVKPKVDAQFVDKTNDKSLRLKVVRTETQAAFDEASPEVRAQVKAETERVNATRIKKKERENTSDDFRLYVFDRTFLVVVD